MFGIFNSKKRIASQISIAVMSTIRLCFVCSKHLDSQGIFHPPYNFWNDSYVVGFVYGLIGWFIHFDYSGSSMKTQDKGEIILRTFEQICGNDFTQAMAIIQASAAAQNNAEFNLAVDHSATAYGAMSGRIKDDDPSALLAEARLLAQRTHSVNIEMASMLGTSASSNSSLGCAVLELSIIKHVKEKFLASTAC
ncbi:MAG: hypothetical protein ACK48P_06420 [Holosporales bacterium]|jgi:hypothetical protein